MGYILQSGKCFVPEKVMKKIVKTLGHSLGRRYDGFIDDNPRGLEISYGKFRSSESRSQA